MITKRTYPYPYPYPNANPHALGEGEKKTRCDFRRAKPLLGTLVEIRAACESEASFIAATDAAFARIEHIHRAMSFHAHTSDVQAIARCSAGERLHVDQDTWNVLQLALRIEHDSDGIFNPTIAPALVRSGLLPKPSGVREAPNHATLASSIRLDEPRVVQVLRPVWIDLGGIAKGYAVDAATDALLEQGVNTGAVNAGGDLRVFGHIKQTVYLRHPANPGAHIAVAVLCEMSCATSGDYFVAGQKTSTDTQRSAIVGARANIAAEHASITVIAPRCAVADALTKVLWLSGIDSAISRALLAKYHAQAVALDVCGAASYA